MKKIFAILALVAFGSAYADSVTLEHGNLVNIGAAGQTVYALGYKKDLTQNLAGDVAIINYQTQGTGKLATRIDSGLTVTQSVGAFSLYTRGSLGERYTEGASYPYYGIEPGVIVPLGNTGITTKVGWRYRSAVDAVANNDQTHTMRYTASYALTKVDTIGVRFERATGDANQRAYNMSYTRNF